MVSFDGGQFWQCTAANISTGAVLYATNFAGYVFYCTIIPCPLPLCGQNSMARSIVAIYSVVTSVCALQFDGKFQNHGTILLFKYSQISTHGKTEEVFEYAAHTHGTTKQGTETWKKGAFRTVAVARARSRTGSSTKQPLERLARASFERARFGYGRCVRRECRLFGLIVLLFFGIHRWTVNKRIEAG